MQTFFVKAGTSINVDLPARSIFVDSITADLSVELTGKGRQIDINYSVRSGAKLYDFPEVVSDWVIKNNNDIDVDIVLKAGDIYYDENRLVGNINVNNDSALPLNIQGSVNITGGDIVAASPKNSLKNKNVYSLIYSTGITHFLHRGWINIHNPIDSGKNILISKLGFSAPHYYMNSMTSEGRLGFGIRFVDKLNDVGFVSNAGRNKYDYLRDSILESSTYSRSENADPGLGIEMPVLHNDIVVGGFFDRQFSELSEIGLAGRLGVGARPRFGRDIHNDLTAVWVWGLLKYDAGEELVLPPGKGLLFSNSGIGHNFNCSINYQEVDV